jgi:hypothetical protein
MKMFELRVKKLRKLAIVVLALSILIMVVMGGCSGSDEGQGQKIAEKIAIYSIENVSGEDWVAESGSNPSNWDDLDAIYADDYLFAQGEVKSVSINSDQISGFMKSGGLKEISDSEYEFSFYYCMGRYPEDEEEQYIYVDPVWEELGYEIAKIVPVVIRGTYGEEAIIHWNGTSFEQVQ